MVYRVVCFMVLLLSCSVLSARDYPYLLHKSFAVQYFSLDSMHHTLKALDSAAANAEVDRLAQWAEDNNDRQLAYAFRLLFHSYQVYKKGIDNQYVAEQLPGLIKEIDEQDMPHLRAYAENLLGNYYWHDYRKYSIAFEYSLAAYNNYSRFSAKEFPPKASYLYDLGLDYYRFKDYATALRYLTEAKNTPSQNNNPRNFNVLNTIGLCYRHMEKYDSAEYYFKGAYDAVKQANVLAWEGIISGNLGITYYRQQRYREAIPLLENDIRICTGKEGRALDNAANSLAILGDIYLSLNEKAKALELLTQSYNIMKEGRKWDNLDVLKTIYPRLAKAYALNGNYELAYNFSDSAKRVSDSDASRKNLLILSGVQQKIDMERQKVDAQLRAREQKIQLMIGVFLVVGIVLLLLVIFFIYRNYNNQMKTNKLLALEKKRSDDLLLNILPSEVAEELKDTGHAAAKYFDDVTVIFTDFVGFTRAGERMSPQQLVDELDTCFKAFDAIIDKYNIEKIKTIGDAYLAVSGLPLSNMLHAEHAVKAAIEIGMFIEQRKKQLGEMAFDIRIGIHSGSVVAGIVGVKKFAYDIWGDTVNTAARMEQNSEPGRINISHTTYELVKDRFKCEYRGEINAKNKGHLIMYFVEAMNG